MKIDINKKYRTKGGHPVVIYAVYEPTMQNSFCVHGAFWDGDNWRDETWILSGHNLGPDNPYHLDLVEVRPERVVAQQAEWEDKYIDMMRQRTSAQAERDAAQTLADALAEKLEAWLEVAANCSIEEGVCCCGDDMKNHSNPMHCGHSPVDHGAYVAMQLAEDTRATLAQITEQRSCDALRAKGGKTDGNL